ncbi:MAG TPA: hypothetical protein VFX30_06930 [bacterium]|nr:hypothetical protein [bacterium]
MENKNGKRQKGCCGPSCCCCSCCRECFEKLAAFLRKLVGRPAGR